MNGIKSQCYEIWTFIYRFFKTKKASAINSFGNNVSLDVGRSEKREEERMLARQLNIFDAVLSPNIMAQEQIQKKIFVCLLSHFCVSESINVYECVYAKVRLHISDVKVKELPNSLVVL
jgi:hypothetical protein